MNVHSLIPKDNNIVTNVIVKCLLLIKYTKKMNDKTN